MIHIKYHIVDLLIVLLFQVSIFSTDVAQKEELQVTPVPNPVFRINIDRKISGANCTQGYIAVNDSVIAYTLELPDENNRQYISSIPKGIYSAFIRTDGNKGWRIELENVPNRTLVQLHLGSYTKQIQGCILIGAKVDIEHCTVGDPTQQRAGIDKLQAMINRFTTDLILNQANTKPVAIEVEISGI